MYNEGIMRCFHITNISRVFYMHFKNRFKVYLEHDSLLSYCWTQSKYLKNKSKILFLNYFTIISTSLQIMGVKISPKIHILESYILFRLQKYIWSITLFKLDKRLVEVYIIYGTMTWWLGHRFTKPEAPGSKP